MTLIRDVRVLDARPFPSGHKVASTAFINTDTPKLLIRVTQREHLLTSDLPEVISLRVTLEAVPIAEREGITIQYHYEEDAFTPQNLYGDQTQFLQESAYQAVRVCFAHSGYFVDDTGERAYFTGTHLREARIVLPQDSLLFEKRFLTQSQSQSVQEGRDGTISPPGLHHGYPLWAYGGFFRPGCPFEEIEQMVFSIIPARGETSLALWRIQYWTSQGIHPPEKGELKGDIASWEDPLTQEHTRSLSQSLRDGGASFDLIQEDGLTVTYHSFAVSGCDTIHFRDIS